MEQKEGCLFCSLQNDEDDRKVGILYRGEHWFIIMNLFPYTNGHIMVVASRHIDGISQIKEEEGKELIELLALSEKAIDSAYNPDALNIGVNRGVSAGAGVVGHLHFHLVPRWNGDTNFMTALAETRVVSEDIGDSYDRLAPFFK